jgi:PAS domain S-box-containing protein
MDLYTTLDQSGRAVAVCLDYLRDLGVEWSPHPTDEDVRREYERTWSQLGSRAIEDLIGLPVMTDPASLATLDVLTKVLSPAMSTDEDLVCLVVCEAVRLSLERGNSDGSCVPYLMLGMITGLRFGNYEAGYRFGRLAYDLVEQRGFNRFQARTYVGFAHNVMPWTKYVRASRDLLRRGFDAANRIGDVTFAAYSCMHLNANLLAAGDALEEVQHEAERGLEFARGARFGLVIDVITTQLRLIRTLRGLTPKFGSFNDEEFDESLFEHHLASDTRLALRGCKYWILTLQARYLAGDYVAALAALSRAQPLLWLCPSYFETAEFHFYGALSHAASWDSASLDERQQHFEALTTHHRQLEIWAEHCPENFENRAALVGAEIVRIEGRKLDAMRLYERAIRSARQNGFVHNEGVANELAGRFYLECGLEKNGFAHLHDARACYALWGADGKVRQLDRLYPRLAALEGYRATTTIGSPVQQLDLASVVKASQAVSSEIVLPTLIERLMTITVENAGADRGLLILPENDDYLIQAEAQASGDKIQVVLYQDSITAVACPEALLRYVIRTHESVILDDALRPNPFSEDDYLRGRQARSILCLPLIKQARLTGLLYLENRLTSHAFTPDRVAALDLLAAQAAISLENTRLYSDLQEREAEVRRLVDSALDAVLIIDEQGCITEWNSRAESMFGWRREEAVGQRLSEMVIPMRYRSDHERGLRHFLTSGAGSILNRSIEIEAVRRNGSEFPVELSVAAFRIGGTWAFSGFVRDITERKRAEATLRRYREVEMELAHANRVATMGQLSASIAHEVRQPIAAAVTNAQAALRWLGAQPPDLEEVRQALGRIVKEGNRASDVIGRIRALIKKAPPQKDRVEINEAILEVIALTRGEVVKNGVSVETQLAERLPLIQGDRVQLQQVILNLIINAVEAMSGVSEGARELLITTAKAASDGAVVAVRDSGPGLAPENLERVFEAFYTTKPRGLGMGLSICRSIIEAQGGQVWASSNDGPGTTFQFSLPSARENRS